MVLNNGGNNNKKTRSGKICKIRLTQPQVELEAWAELGNMLSDCFRYHHIFCQMDNLWFEWNCDDFEEELGHNQSSDSKDSLTLRGYL